jgi:pimeloyl-ACP methyl ester carboxylesterase/DNA-binding CsgD family transcriptional regulator
LTRLSARAWYDRLVFRSKSDNAGSLPLDTSLKSSLAKPDAIEVLVTAVATRQAEFADLVTTLSPLLDKEHSPPPEITLKLSTALHTIEQESQHEDRLYSLVDAMIAPTVALNEAGRILAMNPGAVQVFGLQSGAGIAALGLSRHDFHRLKNRLETIPGPTILQAARTLNGHEMLPVIMIGSYHYRYRAFVLIALQHHWPQSVDLAFKEVFGLSPSECEVLAALSRGMSSEHIADTRGRSLGTIRQQIKAILRKLGSPSQVQAATMAAAAATAASEMGLTGDQTRYHYDDNPMTIGEFINASRRVAWRRFGDPQGTTVLMMHGPSFGAGEFAEDRRQALAHQLDVIALERPGYGRTHPPAANEHALQCQCDDALALMDRLNIQTATVLAHEVGLIPALALAQHAPDRIHAILSVSAAPPFRQLEQINAMPAHQAIFLQAARHARWMARLMIRLLIVRVRRLGPDHWYQVVFGDDQRELAIMAQPSLRAGSIGTYSFNHDQQGSGYEQDLQIMLQDWGQLVSRCPAPLKLLHGDSNDTTPLAYLDIFRELKRDIDIELVANEGLTLAVSQPALVWDRLASLC